MLRKIIPEKVISKQELWIPMGFPGGASGKEHDCQCRRHRDVGSITGSGRSPGGENNNPLQYSCLENPKDKGSWWDMVYRVTKSQIQVKQLSSSSSMIIYAG